MDESLKSFFKSIAPFEEGELEEASGLFHTEILKKHDFFCKAGHISTKVAFVKEGILRSFYHFNDSETTTYFQVPGTIAVSLQSLLRKTPALENIQALEQSTLIWIDGDHLNSLYEGNWKWQQVGRRVVEEVFIEMEERSISLQTKSASERYAEFMISYPTVLRFVPLNQIASYLGMSPETLSRIRKSI